MPLAGPCSRANEHWRSRPLTPPTSFRPTWGRRCAGSVSGARGLDHVEDWPRPGTLLLEIGQGRPTEVDVCPDPGEVEPRRGRHQTDPGVRQTTPEENSTIEPVRRPEPLERGWRGHRRSGTTYGDAACTHMSVSTRRSPEAVVLDSAGRWACRMTQRISRTCPGASRLTWRLPR